MIPTVIPATMSGTRNLRTWAQGHEEGGRWICPRGSCNPAEHSASDMCEKPWVRPPWCGHTQSLRPWSATRVRACHTVSVRATGRTLYLGSHRRTGKKCGSQPVSHTGALLTTETMEKKKNTKTRQEREGNVRVGWDGCAAVSVGPNGEGVCEDRVYTRCLSFLRVYVHAHVWVCPGLGGSVGGILRGWP
jgi:hypothetical protein